MVLLVVEDSGGGADGGSAVVVGVPVALVTTRLTNCRRVCMKSCCWSFLLADGREATKKK